MGDQIVSSSGVRSAARKAPKRKLAARLTTQLRRKILAAPLGKEVTREEYIARMLTDLATNMETQTVDGTTIKIVDPKEWLDIVKFMHSHLDGPPNQEAQFSGVNIFKVYAGVDVDKV